MMACWCYLVMLSIFFTKGLSSPLHLLDPDKPDPLPPQMTVCPIDSVLNNNNKCECLPCPVEFCQNGEVIYPVDPPQPGQCCYNLKCVHRPCDVDGLRQLHNTSWIQNCQTCKCYNGLKFCKAIEGCEGDDVGVTEIVTQRKDKTCLTDSGVVYLQGQKWSTDLCTNCTCDFGEIKCIAHYCEQNQQTYCDPLTSCTLDCPYGLRVSTQTTCELCECALNPLLLNITKQKKISTDHVYTIIELYTIIEHPDDVLIQKQESSSIFLIVALVVLTLICGGLLWRLIRSNKLRRSTKMEKSPDLRNYIPVTN